MSILFLFVAFMVAASHQNWKQRAEENQRIANQRLANQKALAAEIAKKEIVIQKEKVARQLMLAQLESQWQAEKRKYESKEKELLTAQANLLVLSNTLQQAEERIKEQDQQVVSLTTQIRGLVENIAHENQRVIELQTQVFENRGKVDALEQQRAVLANSLAKSTKVLNSLGKNENSLTEHIAPVLTGIVTGVTGELVEFSLGEDDGIKNGHTVDVYRDNRFRGSATVIRTFNNRAVARLIPEMTKSAIEIGDNVTTEWSRPVAMSK
ncbi:MAG TPA: hypothetical protein PKA83_05450 [Pirellulaceae bacterium]|nr:hypothetical protein [Pirellulaceae bacterium]